MSFLSFQTGYPIQSVWTTERGAVGELTHKSCESSLDESVIVS